MSVTNVINDIHLVGEQIFDHTPLIKHEVERFLDNFERNERHREFDGIIRASHTLVEATDATLESLGAEATLQNLNEQLKATTDAINGLVIPTFQQEHDEYLSTIKRTQAEQLRIVDAEIERQHKSLRERQRQRQRQTPTPSREGTADSLTSPDISTTSEVDLN